MIISASRRTDLPALHVEWLSHRIEEGFVYVRNPFNPAQVSRVDLRPELVDFIVFWTKDPQLLLQRMNILERYEGRYGFQFTITPYGTDVEPGLRDKHGIMETYRELAGLIGGERMVLRYDPILLTDKYTVEFHKNSFRKLLSLIDGQADRIVISFVDDYRRIGKAMAGLGLRPFMDEQVLELAEYFGSAASDAGIPLQTCAEGYELSRFGITHGKCVDKQWAERVIGYGLKPLRQDGNRQGCLCDQSIDIGQYGTCGNGCLYCYAGGSGGSGGSGGEAGDPLSPILAGVFDKDKVKTRKDACSWREGQFRMEGI